MSSSAATTGIRLHLQRQHVYGSDRCRLAIEARLGRTTGPKKISQPKTMEAAPPAPDVPPEGYSDPCLLNPTPFLNLTPFFWGTGTNS